MEENMQRLEEIRRVLNEMKKKELTSEELLKRQQLIDERETIVDEMIGKKEPSQPFEIENDKGEKILIMPLENDINGLSKYKMTPMINGIYNETNSKNIFMNSPIEFDKINNDKEYTDAIKDFFNSERIEIRKEEAEKFNTNSIYMGNLYREENGYYQKQRIMGNKLYHIYNEMKESDAFDKRVKDIRPDLDVYDPKTAFNRYRRDKEEIKNDIDRKKDNSIVRLVESPSLKARLAELPDPNHRYSTMLGYGDMSASTRLLPNGWVREQEFAVKREDGTEVILQELNTDIDGIYKYRVLYDFYNKPNKENSRVFYSDGIDFKKLNYDKKYAKAVSQLIEEKRLDTREMIAKENGCEQSYIGTIIEKEDGSYTKAVRSPRDETTLYYQIHNLERDGKQVVSDEIKREDYKGALRYNQVLESKQEIKQHEEEEKKEKEEQEKERLKKETKELEQREKNIIKNQNDVEIRKDGKNENLNIAKQRLERSLEQGLKKQENLKKKQEEFQKKYDELIKVGKENEAYKILPEIRKIANDIAEAEIETIETKGNLNTLFFSGNIKYKDESENLDKNKIQEIEEVKKEPVNSKMVNQDDVSKLISAQETSMEVYKNQNRFVRWIKEKFNSLKDRLSKNKNNEELYLPGQTGKDNIKINDEKTSRRKNFIEQITGKGKLQSKEQRKKEFEVVRRWEQQNKKEIDHDENSEQDL